MEQARSGGARVEIGVRLENESAPMSAVYLQRGVQSAPQLFSRIGVENAPSKWKIGSVLASAVISRPPPDEQAPERACWMLAEAACSSRSQARFVSRVEVLPGVMMQTSMWSCWIIDLIPWRPRLSPTGSRADRPEAGQSHVLREKVCR